MLKLCFIASFTFLTFLALDGTSYAMFAGKQEPSTLRSRLHEYQLVLPPNDWMVRLIGAVTKAIDSVECSEPTSARILKDYISKKGLIREQVKFHVLGISNKSGEYLLSTYEGDRIGDKCFEAVMNQIESVPPIVSNGASVSRELRLYFLGYLKSPHKEIYQSAIGAQIDEIINGAVEPNLSGMLYLPDNPNKPIEILSILEGKLAEVHSSDQSLFDYVNSKPETQSLLEVGAWYSPFVLRQNATFLDASQPGLNATQEIILAMDLKFSGQLTLLGKDPILAADNSIDLIFSKNFSWNPGGDEKLNLDFIVSEFHRILKGGGECFLMMDTLTSDPNETIEYLNTNFRFQDLVNIAENLKMEVEYVFTSSFGGIKLTKR